MVSGLGPKITVAFLALLLSPAQSQQPANHYGIYQINLRPGLQRIGIPVQSESLFSGEITAFSGAELSTDSTLSVGGLLPEGSEFYVEIVWGLGDKASHIGHRFEVDETATRVSTTPGRIAIDLSSGLNTTATLPELSQCYLELFPHLTLGQVFPPSQLRASQNPLEADKVQMLVAGHFETYFLLANPDGISEWRNLASVASRNMNSIALPPGMGLFFHRAANETTTISFAGRIRSQPFTQVLSPSWNFLSGGFPRNLSPREGGLVQEGVGTGANFAEADQLHLANGSNDYPRYYPITNTGAREWRRLGGGAESINDLAILDFRRGTLFRRQGTLLRIQMPYPGSHELWMPEP